MPDDKKLELDDAVVSDESKQPEQKRKKSAKEVFAEATGFAPVETKEPIRGFKENSPIIDDDGVLDLKLEIPEEPKVSKKDLGLTEAVEEEEETEESRRNVVYKASKVEKVPALKRDGMQLRGLGRRRQVKQGKKVESPRINSNTVKAFPDKGLGSVNKTTFKG